MARKEAVFKMKLDSDDAVKDVKKLDKDFTHLADTIQTDVSGSISAMEDRLYELAAAGDRSSKEFQDLQKKTAEYRKIVIETDRSIDALAEQGRGLSTALGIAEGTVAGFQAFTGITAVLGDENEELLETITKLQAAQGVLNSIEVIKQQIQNNSIKITQAQVAVQRALNVAVGNGSKAMKLFRGALLATGIGALIVGIGALIANFDKLKAMVSSTNETQKAYNDTLEDFKKGAQEAIEETNKVESSFKLAREGVISKEEALKTYNETLGDAFGEAKNLNEAEQLFIDKTDAYIKVAGLRAQADALFAKAAEEAAKSATAGLESQVGFFDAAAAKLKGDLFGIEAQQESLNQSQREGVKEARENADAKANIFENLAQDLLKQANIEEKASGIRKQGSEDAAEADREAAKAAKQRANALDELRKRINDLTDSIRRRNLTDTARSLEDNRRQRDEELSILQDGYEKQLISKEQFEATKLQIEKDFKERRDEIVPPMVTATLQPRQINEVESEKVKNKLITKSFKEQLKERTEYFKQNEEAMNNIRSKSFELATTLTELFTTKSTESQKKAFKITKGINIAQTVQSGLQGVVNALSAKSALPEPIASIQKGLNAATVAATTALNVKKIKATTFQGSGGVSVGGSSGGGGIQGATAGSFNIGDNTSADTTDLNPDGTVNNGGVSGMQKVYVTEQDITNTQNKVQAVENIATF